ncbi:MAG: ribosome-associated translation inhibitor RaiA [Coriobacteriales bacterium]|jgi:putative sigma-54 modulation protein|nr:ribosome-associated translation inhibitor RaiA [Coriobacteriales bacterium]MDO5709218.1 ribosome-associated translation inhibitor RaiA [Coriobacteriales bacterium]
MADIKISGRKLSVTDSMRERVEEKIGGALKVFDIQPMSADVVLRVDKNPSNPDRRTCEVTVYVRDRVVRVTSSSDDMDAAIDEAASKVTRQIRKYKTKVLERRTHAPRPVTEMSVKDLAELIEEVPEDEQLVREKYVDLTPMTEEEALIQTDLIGHGFYVFENATTGLINVIYRRRNGGYGIIKPKIESEDGIA